ncbi:MAG: cytochrome bd ubiquinol oxidase subunit, partial [Actinomycetota bacterium]|nr:cytochrome bd ubiquinol oxidase subunit [Actinomycetota bacterium]
FIGIYLYGWDRLSPRAHLLLGLPIPIAGVASAWFVVTANAWMNQPRGFDVNGYLATRRVTHVDPIKAMFNPAVPVQTTHMVLAAFMVSGFATASVYAARWLRGRRDRYDALAFLLPFTIAVIVTPVQIGVGDWAARFIGHNQPVKLAAAEGLNTTQSHAPLSIGALYIGGRLHGGIEIPGGLSFLLGDHTATVVHGLDAAAPADRPPVPVVHSAFEAMVAIGFFLLGLGGWFGVLWWRRRVVPANRAFLVAAIAAGPLAVVALECGWVVTEVGRQPWIVYGVMRVRDAVTTAPNIRVGYFVLLAVYSLMTVATVFVLRRQARQP